MKNMILPTDPKVRKGLPITTGVLDYFPLAIAYVAEISKAGNDQHNPGQPLHWSRGKSDDHADCAGRHLIDRGSFDTDGKRHTGKLVWRALAMLQLELEGALSKVEPEVVSNSTNQPLDVSSTRGFSKVLRFLSEGERSRAYNYLQGLPCNDRVEVTKMLFNDGHFVDDDLETIR